jgi:hypothetical protein
MGVETNVSHAPEVVMQLGERFGRNCDSYLTGGFNVTQLRGEGIDARSRNAPKSMREIVSPGLPRPRSSLTWPGLRLCWL